MIICCDTRKKLMQCSSSCFFSQPHSRVNRAAWVGMQTLDLGFLGSNVGFSQSLSESQLSSGASDGNNSLQPVGRVKQVHMLRHLKQFWAQRKHSVHDNYCCYYCCFCASLSPSSLLCTPNPQGCLLQLKRMICSSSNAT